jgi:hypothetical protein
MALGRAGARAGRAGPDTVADYQPAVLTVTTRFKPDG